MRHRPRPVAFAVAALIAAAPAALAEEVDLGWFMNGELGGLEYVGPFGDFVAAYAEGDQGQHTRVEIDLTGILGAIGHGGVVGASVVDTGENSYGNAPGADVDLLRFLVLGDGASITYAYDGPNATHWNETSAQLFQRVESLDWESGGGLSSMRFVSLGDGGRLSATLAQPWHAGDGPLVLALGEAGLSESFRVTLDTVPVPAPGAAAAFGLAIVGARRRRRVAHAA